MDLTIGMWGALLGVFLYVLGGAAFDALREWRWNREFGRPMRAHERTMGELRRRR
jgi:predicted PurR-regulated permease PerM